jgi:uncharacterized protein YbgA (DUF1722 family)/uncharacterized protein YbbK (DUF523 family)
MIALGTAFLTSTGSARRPWQTDTPVRIGVSSCLLGQDVRWDGGHKRDAYLVETLGPLVEWIAVCPEVELGLGVPRDTLRLERRARALRLVMTATGVDHTDAMRRWADRRLRSLARADLSGYVLKRGSPSCGMERVRVYAASGPPAKVGRGTFAEALIERFPLLPVEEEGRLSDMRLRESFIERVFAYRRLRDFLARRWTPGGLVAFHTAHKLQLMAHAPDRCARLGRLVAHAKDATRASVAAGYAQAFMETLVIPATTRRHTNVLQHMLGYVTRELPSSERQELVGVIEDYRRGLVPLIVPITLLRHHVGRLGVAYLDGQTYLEPHPKELMLRNHV